MIYFTSGVSNSHGALPVQRRTDSSDDAEPRRLALAMWYLTDQESEEYCPTFKDSRQTPSTDYSNNATISEKPKKVYDPTAPKELFTIPNRKRVAGRGK